MAREDERETYQAQENSQYNEKRRLSTAVVDVQVLTAAE